MKTTNGEAWCQSHLADQELHQLLGRVRRIREALQIDSRTVKRWRQWWLDNFVRSSFWKAARARFMPPLCERTLPLSFWLSFELEERQRLLAVLQFLKPITTPTAWKEFAVALHLNRRLWQFTALNSALTQFWCTCGTFGPFALALYHQLLLQNLHVQCISMILRPHPGRRYCWHAGCER